MHMTVRRLLIVIPIAVIVLLLQSYFWVPTYEEQTRGNPERLTKYITASIGDASLLNPILSSDSASADIESLVFEGLIDRDKDLSLRGRLATSWEIGEEAYFYVNTDASVPGLGKASAEEVVNFLNEMKRQNLVLDLDSGEDAGPGTGSFWKHLRKISLIPAKEFVVTRKVKGVGPREEETRVRIRVKAPPKIKLVLDQVDQHVFDKLTRVLGEEYFKTFQAEAFIDSTPSLETPKLKELAKGILPPTEHNPVITFHLRPNVKFHDGHVFDAHDVKFTYESIMDPRNLSPRVADYEPVKCVQVVDPLTVRVVYKRLYSPALSTWTIGILPEHRLNKQALRKEALSRGKDPEKFSMRQSNFNRHPVGCGPFKFREWEPDQYILLDRFNDYWEGPPNYKSYAYRIIPERLAQEMEFYAGTIDSYNVRPHQVERLKDDPRYQSFSGLSFSYTYIGYNMRREPFDDPRVRKALGMAIDVEKIIDYVLYGQGERITGPFLKQTEYYDDGVRPLPYDPKGALRLLKKAGWHRNQEGWLVKNGKRLRFTLITNNGNELREAVLAIAQDAWEQVGIEVRTDLLEWSVFIQERVNKLDFDALVLGWQMGIEPDLYQIWHSSQTDPHELNFVGFKNKEADELIEKIRREYDHEKKVEYAHALHRIIAREQPYTFLYVPRWTAVLDKRIVIRERDEEGNVVYKKIKPTKTGDYTFYFNKWIKLPEAPRFGAER